MTLYDVVLDVRTTRTADGVTDALAGYDVTVRDTARNQVEVSVTLGARTLRQAMMKALMAVEDGSGGQVVGLTVTRGQLVRRFGQDDDAAAPLAAAHSAWLGPLLEALDGAAAPVPARARPRPTAPPARGLRLVR